MVVESLSGEHALIFDCVRAAFDRCVPPRQYDPDWGVVKERAGRYGMLPIVTSGLAALNVSAPADLIRELSIATALSKLRFEHQIVPAFREAIEVLKESQMRPIVLKGMALAHQVYPRPELRTFGDIDILLPMGEIDAATRALCRVGWWQSSTEEAIPDHHHGPVLFSRTGGVAIELHHHILPGKHPFKVDVNRLLSNVDVASIAGLDVHVLKPEIMLFHICVHVSYGHAYEFFPLRSLMDVFAITTEQRDSIDWNKFISFILETRASGAVYWPLRLSRQWLGANVPDFVLSKLEPVAPLKTMIASLASPSLIVDGVSNEDRGTAVLAQLLLDLSNCTGCPPQQQLRSIFTSLFPSHEYVSHLPTSITDSRLRYTAALTNMGRLNRGIGAFARLFAQTIGRDVDLPAYDASNARPTVAASRASTTLAKDSELSARLSSPNIEAKSLNVRMPNNGFTK